MSDKTLNSENAKNTLNYASLFWRGLEWKQLDSMNWLLTISVSADAKSA